MKERKHLGNILFATNLSEDSARAIDWLRWFGRHYGSTVCVVHVLDLLSFGLSVEEVAHARSMASKRLDRFVRKYRLNQKPFAQKLIVGDAAVAVTEFVGKHDISLIVLGSQAIGLNRLLQGSISEEVLRRVNCPVFTVGPRAKSPRRPVAISHVLFATNLAKQSGSVFTHCEFLFKGNPHCGLALAHFLPKESKSAFERHKTRKRLRGKLIKLVPEEVRRQIEDVVVESCSPVKGILEFSKEGRFDLVVLGVKDAGPFTRAATHRPRSITHQIIQYATCPVLTIRV
ncbi:MAG: universal stress protein [Candidatus Acidiferrales bacterium]